MHKLHDLSFYANTNCMTITMLIVLALIILLTLNVHLSINLNYNILINHGNIVLKMFGLSIFRRDITLYGNYFTLTNRKRKVIKVKISMKDNSIQFVQDILHSMKRKIYLQSCKFGAEINLTNAYHTAMLIGYVQSISGILLSKLSARNTDAIITHNVCPCDDTAIKVSLGITIYLCLYDLIWSVFVALYKRRIRIYGKRYRQHN